MRSKSPELMDKILKFAEEFYLNNGHSPVTSTIAAELGISRATAYRYLVEMDSRQMLDYDGKEIHTAVTRKYNKEHTQTPIVGSIPCGSPQYSFSGTYLNSLLPMPLRKRQPHHQDQFLFLNIVVR